MYGTLVFIIADWLMKSGTVTRVDGKCLLVSTILEHLALDVETPVEEVVIGDDDIIVFVRDFFHDLVVMQPQEVLRPSRSLLDGTTTFAPQSHSQSHAVFPLRCPCGSRTTR